VNELCELTIREARQLLQQREISSVELTEATLRRIAQTEDKVHACLTVTHDLALEQAAHADACLNAGQSKTLTGVPVLVKDLISTAGIRTTCGSRMLENFVPPYDATVIEKLRAQQAVLIGKTNMDEFAMGLLDGTLCLLP